MLPRAERYRHNVCYSFQCNRLATRVIVAFKVNTHIVPLTYVIKIVIQSRCKVTEVY